MKHAHRVHGHAGPGTGENKVFRQLREKRLATVWRLEKEGTVSFLLGTAHFFPYSFRSSLERLFRQVRWVLFEGPLDEASMARVVAAGCNTGHSTDFIDSLPPKTLKTISRILVPLAAAKGSSALYNAMASMQQSAAVSVLQGMKPWLAFFTIYVKYVESIGWKHSVDREAYCIASEMNKEIVFMESIEEQIQVLEGLSVPNIVDFLRRAEHWPHYTKQFVKWYLAGDIEEIKANRFGFPTRHPSVIDCRDDLFCRRSRQYLEEGGAAVCVGVPHIPNMCRMLAEEGYSVTRAGE